MANIQMRSERRSSPGSSQETTLPPKWFAAMFIIGFAAWLFVGTSGLMPHWLWATILGCLILSVAGIAIFGPRVKTGSSRK